MFSGRLLAHGAPTHTSERGGRVSSLIVFWITVERPSLRSVTRTRYSPSGAIVPASVSPFHSSRNGRCAVTCTASASRRTRSPSRLTMSTVRSSETFSVTEKSLLRRSGEKSRARPATWMTGGALLSRWARKKAPNVAVTNRTNAARAASAAGSRVLLELVLTDDDDDIPAASGGGRRVIHRADVLDIEDLRDVVALGARAGLVHDDGCGDAPVRVVAGLDVRRAIAGLG